VQQIKWHIDQAMQARVWKPVWVRESNDYLEAWGKAKRFYRCCVEGFDELPLDVQDGLVEALVQEWGTQ